MVTDITIHIGGQRVLPGECDSMTYEARLRYWEEEWLSQLLEEALRLKGEVSGGQPGRKDHAARA